VEGREHRNTGTFGGKMVETSSSRTVSTKLERIAKLAREMPQAALTTLAHHIDIDWLREAYRRTRKDGATGIDRQTADEYARNLDENLRSLLERVKSGSYVAPPVRRVHIPKAGDGSQTRPIGIPTFEDKVLQRAVAMVLLLSQASPGAPKSEYQSGPSCIVKITRGSNPLRRPDRSCCRYPRKGCYMRMSYGRC
jgi:hypothetical protein